MYGRCPSNPTPGVACRGVTLGHQGGWDEMLLVLVPLLIFGLLLWMAARRAARLEEAAEEGARDEADVPPDRR